MPGVMQPNPVPTLAAAIAAGERLLATGCPDPRSAPGRPERLVGLRSTVVIPAPGRSGPTPDAPAPDDDWQTADDIALQAGWDPWTVDEYLRDGVLHGHEDSDTGEWQVRGRVAEAFLQGRDPAAQRRACGCRALRLVHGRRRTSCPSDGWAALR